MPGQFAPSPRNRTPPLEGSRVSGTDPEERGRLSDPHQIAVRAIYKIPPRTSSAPNTIKNILASSIHRHAREAVQAPAAFWAVNSTAGAGFESVGSTRRAFSLALRRASRGSLRTLN